MATSGPSLPVSAANFGTGGVNWTNPSNITVEAGQATCVLSGSNPNSNYLRGYNYSGLAIPTAHTIDGIEVTASIYRDASAASIYTDTFYLSKNGTAFVGDAFFVFQSVTTTPTTFTAGGPTSLFGTTWTPAELNASTMSIMGRLSNISAPSTTCRIAWYKIKVYHTGAREVNVGVSNPAQSFVSEVSIIPEVTVAVTNAAQSASLSASTISKATVAVENPAQSIQATIQTIPGVNVTVVNEEQTVGVSAKSIVSASVGVANAAQVSAVAIDTPDIIPSQVENLQAVRSADYLSAELTWDAVSGSTYQVFRAPGRREDYSLVGSPSSASFSDSGLDPELDYVYVVRAKSVTNDFGRSSYPSFTSGKHTTL